MMQKFRFLFFLLDTEVVVLKQSANFIKVAKVAIILGIVLIIVVSALDFPENQLVTHGFDKNLVDIDQTRWSRSFSNQANTYFKTRPNTICYCDYYLSRV